MIAAAIVVAAGKGERAGGRSDKVLKSLAGRPVLQLAVLPFVGEPRIRQIVLVTPAGREAEFIAVAFPAGVPGSVTVTAVPGGARRQDSVAEGLRALRAEVTHVAIHDAARPLHRGEMLTRLLDRVLEMNAVIPVVPIVDTLIEMTPAGRVAGRADREALRAVQTPQLFARDWIEAAHRAAAIDGRVGTDDASLVMAMKRPVTIVAGEPDNIKLTTEADFALAEALWKGRSG